MNQNVRKLPLWTRTGIMGGIFGMVVTFIKYAEGLAHPFAALVVLLSIIGAVLYSIR